MRRLDPCWLRRNTSSSKEPRLPCVLKCSVPFLQKKDIEKWTKASVPPAGLFRDVKDAQGQPKYSAFNDEGVPTHDAAGKELSTSARKVRIACLLLEPSLCLGDYLWILKA